MTLFLTNTSKSPLVAIVSGIHPGCLMSKALRLACWANSSSNLRTSSSYFFLRSSIRTFFASICFLRSLISTCNPAITFFESFFWLSSSKLKFVWIDIIEYLHSLSLFFYNSVVLVFFVNISIFGFVEIFLQSLLWRLQFSDSLLKSIKLFLFNLQAAL